MQCFVDAHFAGGWSKEQPDEPDSILSRTGSVIFCAGFPLVLANRMQIEISLSTAESEYITFSTAVRDVLSLMEMMNKIYKVFLVNRIKTIVR